jgi:aspartyl-tRNA(Asn)/glutamyl-tRNA(Gln) amidotransferase subunit B
MTGAPAADGFETVIGLEIHVQLATATKMFCADAVEYGAAPNTHVCPVCLGLPGALPVVNARAVELAVRTALALGCEVHETSVFARKNYFYPDLPKGYQITQYDAPLATAGEIEAVRIRRVHLEEDAGKSLHDRFPGRTAVDLNRAGVPLIEIVTEPDLHGPDEARLFLGVLKRTIEYLGVSDCDMEKGSLRVDANVSVRPRGDGPLGTRTEVKNLNSFSNVERALAYEAARQARVLETGGTVVHETRLWDAGAGETRPMRGKEGAPDYRYFPEPDLPPLVLEPARVDAIRSGLPELPHARASRFVDAYGLPSYDAGVLTADRAVADYFEAVAALADPKAASNWVMGEVMAWMNDAGRGIDAFPITPDRLAGLVELAAAGRVSSTGAKAVFDRMLTDGRSAAAIVEAEGLAQVSDTDQLAGWVDDALAAHPVEADRLRAGEAKLIGFFTGAVMRASGGQADPERVQALLRERAGE